MIPTPWGGVVSYRSSTRSTMDDAQEMEEAGFPDGSAAWAGYQSGGRGRHPGRTWLGAPGASLLFTVFWRPERFRHLGFAPSLTVGLGVCLWIESFSPNPPALKWPNDVYWDDRKLAGILVRRRLGPSGPGTIHAGIGINLATPEGPQGFRTPAASVGDTGRLLSPEEALTGLLPFLAQALNHADPREACTQRLWRRNQPITLAMPDGRQESGTVAGLDQDGSLILEGPEGRRILSSGE